MKRIISFLLLACMALTFMQAQKMTSKSTSTSLRAEGIDGFGYANRLQPTSKFQRIGVANENISLAALIQLPEVGGCTFREITFHTTSSNSNGQVVIMEDETVIAVASATIKDGWNTVELPSSVAQEGKTYKVGYQVLTEKGSTYPLSLDGDTPLGNSLWFCSSNKPFVKGDKPVLVDKSLGKAYGSFLIFVKLDDPQGRLKDMALVTEAAFPEGAFEPESTQSLTYKLRNLGSNEIASGEFSYKLASGDAVAVPFTQTIGVGETFEGTFDVTFPNQGGMGVFSVEVAKINGKKNVFADKKKEIEYIVTGVGGDIPRKSVLIEQFTSEFCINCPSIEPPLETMHANMKNRGIQINHIAHHAGYHPDWLTNDESLKLVPNMYMTPQTFAPALAYDRRMLKEGAIAVSESFSIQETVDKVLESPQLVTFEAIEQTMDADANKLHIVIKGTLLRNAVKEDAFLTAIITEDGIKARNQSGAGPDFIHNHVVRRFITPAFGTKLTAAEDGTFELVLDADNMGFSKWVWDKCRVIVFVHHNFENSVERRSVLGSASALLGKPLATAEILPEDKPFVRAEAGRIIIEGAVNRFEVFDLSGRFVTNSSLTTLTEGAYIVRVHNNFGVYVSKLLIP